MKKLIKTDKQTREWFYKLETRRFILKHIATNKYFPKTVRWNALVYFHRLLAKGSKVRITKRCVSSYRKNIAAHKFRFSRLELARFINNGVVYGIKKAAW
uniref:Ribosomal protein S14 n=1 Tax=Toxarium undulatum TaxID=210620 RepID=A0A2U9GIM3_9STRA|nr:ribosomal protein S14 [Toxarium undulatum]AWQ64123.1 ribosomal protein S14 [Toxarium undulatum]